jgi:hypothetical protein
MKKFKSAVRWTDPHTTREPPPGRKTGPPLPGARGSPGTDLPSAAGEGTAAPPARRPSQTPGQEPDAPDESSCLGPERAGRVGRRRLWGGTLASLPEQCSRPSKSWPRLQVGQAARPMGTFLRRRWQERRALGSFPWTVANRRTRPGYKVDCGSKHRADVVCIAGAMPSLRAPPGGLTRGRFSGRPSGVPGKDRMGSSWHVAKWRTRRVFRPNLPAPKDFRAGGEFATCPAQRGELAPRCPAQPAPRRAREKGPPYSSPDTSGPVRLAVPVSSPQS